MDVRLRPRFGLRVDLTPDDVMTRFQELSEGRSHSCEIYLLDRQVEMTVDAEQRHYWSPYLKMLLEESGPHTVLRGKFGPNINVWSLFLAAYAVLSITGSGGLLLATSQLQLAQTPNGLLLTGGCLVLAIVVWIAGKIGQRWAYDQMVYIHGVVHQLFADNVVDEIYCEACESDPDVPSTLPPDDGLPI